MLQSLSFNFINDGLEKYLHSLNTKPVESVEASKDRGRLAVKKIKVRNVNGNAIPGLPTDLEADPLKEAGVVFEQFARNPQNSPTVCIVVDLVYLCRHFLD